MWSFNLIAFKFLSVAVCNSSNKCKLGEGDCNTDNDCEENLKCGVNNCDPNKPLKNGKGFEGSNRPLADCCYNAAKGKYFLLNSKNFSIL